MDNMNTFLLDKYKEARGGWSRMLSITCKSCDRFLFFYQKDGPGPLKRSYLDRIESYIPSFNNHGYFHCPYCKECLGFSEPYKKENNRPAIRWAMIGIAYKIIPLSEIKQKSNYK